MLSVLHPSTEGSELRLVWQLPKLTDYSRAGTSAAPAVDLRASVNQQTVSIPGRKPGQPLGAAATLRVCLLLAPSRPLSHQLQQTHFRFALGPVMGVAFGHVTAQATCIREGASATHSPNRPRRKCCRSCIQAPKEA